MAAYDLEEQEQLANIKAWWNQYGNMVSTAVTVLAVAVAAWQGWNWYQRNQSAQAAAIYSAVQRAAGERAVAEAAHRAAVAGRAVGYGLDKQRVLVAVDLNAHDAQEMAGGFALGPEPLLGAAEESDLPFFC